MDSYPKVKSVVPLAEKKLRILFLNGESRIYDCGPLLSDPRFTPLNIEAFFRHVHVDAAGYGILWNDAVDLSESELWINGTTELGAPAESQTACC